MKKSVKNWLQWLQEEFTLPVLLFLLLIAASGVFLFWLIFRYCQPFLILLLLIAFWNIERIEDILCYHFSAVPKYCRGCPGCNYHYPYIRQYTFQTFRKCAVPLKIVSPETEAMIEGQPRPATDHIARAYFTVMKVPDTTNRLSHLTMCNLLTQNLNAIAVGTVYHDCLFVDEIFEDDFSYTVSVAFTCSEDDRNTLQHKISPLHQFESRQLEGEVYDDTF